MKAQTLLDLRPVCINELVFESEGLVVFQVKGKTLTPTVKRNIKIIVKHTKGTSAGLPSVVDCFPDIGCNAT